MKLRSKIIISLLAVSLVPLVISLWIAGGIATDSLEEQALAQARHTALFIEQSTTVTSTENLNYVTLMANSPLLVNAVYSAGLSGDMAQLVSVLSKQEGLPFDLLQVLDKDGRLLYRVFMNGVEEFPAVSGIDHPVIEASMEGDAYAETGLFDERMAITAAAPVRLYGEPIGHLVGVSFMDRHLAQRLKGVSKQEIAFYDKHRIFVSTSPELAKVDLAAVLNAAAGITTMIKGERHLVF